MFVCQCFAHLAWSCGRPLARAWYRRRLRSRLKQRAQRHSAPAASRRARGGRCSRSGAAVVMPGVVGAAALFAGAQGEGGDPGYIWQRGQGSRGSESQSLHHITSDPAGCVRKQKVGRRKGRAGGRKEGRRGARACLRIEEPASHVISRACWLRVEAEAAVGRAKKARKAQRRARVQRNAPITSFPSHTAACKSRSNMGTRRSAARSCSYTRPITSSPSHTAA